ncbi:DUF4097 family beta strand repeat-containing protein [Clostridiaceae bacterium M8S5]|nr:DUF4097 family beta strand repeat-containing protein [Clostridiaceae bacterium M8S5]
MNFKNKKFNIKIVIVVMICAFTIAGVLMVKEGGLDYFKKGFSIGFMNKKDEVKKEESKKVPQTINIDTLEKIKDLKDINNIDIDTVSSNINILSSTSDSISIHFKGTAKGYVKGEEPKLIINKNDNDIRIEIKHKNSNISGSRYFNASLEIRVPTKHFKLFSVNSVSGNIKAKNITSDIFRAETVSGDQDIKECTNKDVQTNCVSGNVKLANITGSLNIDNTSGNLNVEFDKITDSIKMETVSGNIAMIIPNGSNLDLKMDTTSGELSVYSPLSIPKKQKSANITIGDGGNDVSLSSVSGNIYVNNKK